MLSRAPKKFFFSRDFLFLCLQHHNEPKDFEEILMYLNIFFTVLYMIEAGLKFIALRFVSNVVDSFENVISLTDVL